MRHNRLSDFCYQHVFGEEHGLIQIINCVIASVAKQSHTLVH